MKMRQSIGASNHGLFDDTQRRREKGFSLIEVLISLVILAVGLLALAELQIFSIKGGSASNHVTQATILAQNRLEELRRLSYNDSLLTHGQHEEGTLSGTIFSRAHDVADLSSTMKNVTATVRWTEGGPHSISLTTIRAK
jgi:type IV pilus assembly protein PilV